MTKERLVDDTVALPTNRILSAWIDRLQEVVVIGTDSHGKLIVAASCSGARAQELAGLARAEIDALGDA